MTEAEPVTTELEGWAGVLTREETLRLECVRIVAEHANNWTLRSLADDALFLAKVIETGVVPPE